jgi:hypothetical protein
MNFNQSTRDRWARLLAVFVQSPTQAEEPVPELANRGQWQQGPTAAAAGSYPAWPSADDDSAAQRRLDSNERARYWQQHHDDQGAEEAERRRLRWQQILAQREEEEAARAFADQQRRARWEAEAEARRRSEEAQHREATSKGIAVLQSISEGRGIPPIGF